MAAQSEPQSTPTIVHICTALCSTEDVIVISSDGMRFAAHKNILAAASSSFSGMFLLPQPVDAVISKEQLPSVEMSEGSIELGALLRYVYPVAKSQMPSLDDLKRVAMAAKKYGIEAAIGPLQTELTSIRCLTENSLAVFCTACELGWEDAARIASKETLRMDMPSLWTSRNRDGMGDVLGRDVSRLVDLRLTRANGAKRYLSDQTLRSHFQAPTCSRRRCKALYPWVERWASQAAAELEARPVTDVIFSAAFVLKAIAESDTTCTCGATLDRNWEMSSLQSLKSKIDGLHDTI